MTDNEHPRVLILAYVLLLVYIAVIPFDLFLTGLNNALVVCIVGLVGIAPLERNLEITLSAWQVRGLTAVGGAVSWIIISGFTSPESIGLLPKWRTFLLYLSIPLAAVIVADSRRHISLMLLMTALVTGSVGYLTVIHLVVGLPFGAPMGRARSFGPITMEFPRTLGVAMGYGAYGVYTSISFPTAAIAFLRPAALLPERQRVVRLGGCIALVGILFGIIIGQSRSTFLAVTTAIIVMGFVLVVRRTTYTNRQIFSTITALAFVSGVMARQTILQGFLSANKASVSTRIIQYHHAVDALRMNPLSGCGWDCTQISTKFGQIAVHNMWLLLGTAGGFPALILWSLTFGMLVLGSIRLLYVCDETFWYGVIGVTALTGSLIELSLFPGISDVVGVLIAIILCFFGIRPGRYIVQFRSHFGEIEETNSPF